MAILSIDPSSQRSRGSVARNKTRMEELTNIKVFLHCVRQHMVKPLEGWLTICRKHVALEAAGYNPVIETVGVLGDI